MPTVVAGGLLTGEARPQSPPVGPGGWIIMPKVVAGGIIMPTVVAGGIIMPTVVVGVVPTVVAAKGSGWCPFSCPR